MPSGVPLASASSRHSFTHESGASASRWFRGWKSPRWSIAAGRARLSGAGSRSGRAAPDEAQDFVGRGVYPARRANACVARLHDLRGRPNQTSASHIVAMPCSAVPSTRMVMFPLRKSIGAVRRDFASEKNGRPSSPAVARRHAVARQRAEQVELFPLLRSLPRRQRWAGHDDGHRRADDQRPSR